MELHAVDAPAEFARRGPRRAFEDYFALETALAGSGIVDGLAHADYVKRLAILPEAGLADLYDPLVAAAARTGTAVEISRPGSATRSARSTPLRSC